MPGAGSGSPDDYRPSRWSRRLVAFLVDGVFLVGLSIALGLALGQSVSEQFTTSHRQGTDLARQIAAGYVAIAAYMVPLMVLTNGRTIGKKLLGLRVVRTDGERMSLTRAGWRELIAKSAIWQVFELLPAVGWALSSALTAIDGLWPLRDRENRALHDLFAATWVVDTRPLVEPEEP